MSIEGIRAFGISKAPARPDPAQVSEDAVAFAFTQRHRHDMRFCHTADRWYLWDGIRWCRDVTNRVIQALRAIARVMSDGSRSVSNAKVVKGADFLARSEEAHAVTAEVWDQDPWLLGTPEGIVDLRTGILGKPDPEAHITCLTGCAPVPSEPVEFLRFLEQVTCGDQDVIAYLQRVCGYMLTGCTREHALFFIHGPGGNGKSVFAKVLEHILGDYARTAAMDTFTASFGTRHPTELAMLQGARGVFASETESGTLWAESRIKQLTGGDKITARFMRQDFFTFVPQFKLFIIGNHAPSLKNVDEAMRRRFHIIPFLHKPPKPDPQLEEKLKAEAPAILHWMLQGCLEWQRIGLNRPRAISEATEAYFSEQDVFGQWQEECCELQHDYSETPTALFSSWGDFSKTHGEPQGSIKSFSAELQKRGFRKHRTKHGRFFMGLRLVPKDVPRHWQDGPE